MLEIVVYSDYLCPWCWPAAVRLRDLQAEFPNQLKLVHKSYVLRPPEEGEKQFSEYHLQHRSRAHESTGLPYGMPAIGAPYPSSSMPALIASKWMLLNHPEHFENFNLEMFQAFFEFGLDISKYPILKQLASSFGVDEDQFEAGVKDPKYEKLVLEDHANAKNEGVDGIPSVIIGDAAINGAVPIEDYRQAIKKALA